LSSTFFSNCFRGAGRGAPEADRGVGTFLTTSTSLSINIKAVLQAQEQSHHRFELKATEDNVLEQCGNQINHNPSSFSSLGISRAMQTCTRRRSCEMRGNLILEVLDDSALPHV